VLAQLGREDSEPLPRCRVACTIHRSTSPRARSQQLRGHGRQGRRARRRAHRTDVR
jgi:hypothetical protein